MISIDLRISGFNCLSIKCSMVLHKLWKVFTSLCRELGGGCSHIALVFMSWRIFLQLFIAFQLNVYIHACADFSCFYVEMFVEEVS